MQVYISCSGEASEALGKILRHWIKQFLPGVTPWTVSEDLPPGEDKFRKVREVLGDCHWGIICVTPENVTDQELHFEAGAIAKAFEKARVIPLLLHLELSELSRPLSNFRPQKVTKNDIWNIFLGISQVTDNYLTSRQELFNASWHQIEQDIKKIPINTSDCSESRPPNEILEDLVRAVRNLEHRLDIPKNDALEELRASTRDIEQYVEVIKNDSTRLYGASIAPMILEDIASNLSSTGNYSIVLLFCAGLVRLELPWFAEILVEYYRDLRSSDMSVRQEAFRHLRKVMNVVFYNPEVMQKFRVSLSVIKFVESTLREFERSYLASLQTPPTENS